MAASRGLDRAGLEYPLVRAGLILMMDRTFTHDQNAVIVDKAVRYASRGIVGVDIAGPRPEPGRYAYGELEPLVSAARAAGLGVTIHVGEEGGAPASTRSARSSSASRPDGRHGILAAQDDDW